jgi:hypothetical protein
VITSRCAPWTPFACIWVSIIVVVVVAVLVS